MGNPKQENLESFKKHSARTIQIVPNVQQAIGQDIQSQAMRRLNIRTGAVSMSKLFVVDYPITDTQLMDYAKDCIQDHVTDEAYIDSFFPGAGFRSVLAIAKLPGVTDDEGISAQTALADYLNQPFDTQSQHIFSQEIVYFENLLSENELIRIAKTFLANPLINHIATFEKKAEEPFDFQPYFPYVQLKADNTIEYIDLDIPDEALLALSHNRILALNLEEMHAIQAYFNDSHTREARVAVGLPEKASDCELEILAQTWSEHCKHKEFNANITFFDKDTGQKKVINSLFKTYIKGATDVVAKKLLEKNNHWLIKVFSDNAGVVKASDRHLFVWKVETHNSPSALDPYGGAITGILGVNRDAMGTGIGGADLLFNTDVLCFGFPDYDRPLLTGQLHPKQIMDGVIKGIEDGGNKSGVPTVNGAILFDNRYSGKPLVYCGTGALMPHQFNGKNAWEKPIDTGDLILMAGGRVGKDGIHGATFSSIELNEHSPQSAVQIGSPITQKKLADFMVKAAESGLLKTSTDNGAGGLSSSIGELAEITNGAVVHLEKVPLKYAGLKPWEIFVSESQERMTLVVTPANEKALFDLADAYEVEITTVGFFTDLGYLDIRFEDEVIALLDMDFLHNGVPQKQMVAEWQKPQLSEPTLPKLDYNNTLLELLASYNIRSREHVIRQYDHEVKGKSTLKPLMGKEGKAPQDAAVIRLDFDDYAGIAVSNGIAPQYGDINPYEMSCGAFDEGIRQIISIGGQLPNTRQGDDIFWSVNDNFCVPDSEYHPTNNPDGKEKLAKLVLMAEGLYDMATFFDIPLTSGKDSMKNDFKADGQKISIPPTILYSMTAKIPDVRQVVSSEFKAVGDIIYLIGKTYDELGASALYRLHNKVGANVPTVRKQQAKDLYAKVMEANANNWIESSHDLSDGGLAIALAEASIGSGLGAKIDLSQMLDLSPTAKLFSESHSRFLVSVQPQNSQAINALFGDMAYCLGEVTDDSLMVIHDGPQRLVHIALSDLTQAWTTPWEVH